MTPFRTACGLTLALAALGAGWAARELLFLQPYWGAIWAAHGRSIAANAALLLCSLGAAIYWAALQAGLGRLGQKLSVADKALQGRAEAHDRDLAEALDRDRRGDWNP